jgi:rubrerythrin
MTIWECKVCEKSKCKFDDGFGVRIKPGYNPGNGCPMCGADVNGKDQANWKPSTLIAIYKED